MARKRLLVLSDTHCGHKGGLTPTQWQESPERAAEANQPSHTGESQAKLWHAYRQTIQRLRPIDYCVHNGDAVEGKGERSGGTELITADREEQANMAVRCLNYVRPREGYYLTYGTPYHTGSGEDWEKVVAMCTPMNESVAPAKSPSTDISLLVPSPFLAGKLAPPKSLGNILKGIK